MPIIKKSGLPEGGPIKCTMIFIQGAQEHKARETRATPLQFSYRWSGSGSAAEEALARQQLHDAKARAYEKYLEYVADFEKRFPDGYIMYKKTEWFIGGGVSAELAGFIKHLPVKGVPSDF